MSERWDSFSEISEQLRALSAEARQAAYDNLLRPGGTWDNMLLPTPESPRRPRRDEVLTLRISVESLRPNPRVTRQITLASDLFLDEVHDVLTELYGWKEKRRYRFGSAAGYNDRETEHYPCAFETGRGERAAVEVDTVRLDELLHEPGDSIYHRYGTRQEWQRVLRLEAVSEHTPSTPRAACTAGPKSLDLEAVNLTLSAFGQGSAAEISLDPEEVPEPLARILSWQPCRTRRQVAHLASQAMIDRPPRIDKPSAIDAVQPFSRLLAMIGPDGLALDEHAQIPAMRSAALFHELGMNPYWFGRGRPGSQPVPIAILRNVAESHELTSTFAARIRLTERGRDYLDDPLGLFWYLAERVRWTVHGFADIHGAVIVYLLGAATDTDDPAPAAARFLDEAGRAPEGHPFNMADDLRIELREFFALMDSLRMTPVEESSCYPIRYPATRMFALAALARWPRRRDIPAR